MNGRAFGRPANPIAVASVFRSSYYRPSKLGLTTTVGGQQGRFKLDANGMAILRQEQ
jgi:hypothetical protein